MPATNVLLAEDHAMVRDALPSLLDRGGRTCGRSTGPGARGQGAAPGRPAHPGSRHSLITAGHGIP
ncbi:hypothetical protein [Streptoalloteichus hindustanus]|uniref:hypothetical protein n=1 Tax=Streptoalloteichus hindustanus TaxID=2017 RepID=UPI0009367232|nr:hypothetical protein [Streptoalloteichus hindustanus]